MIRNWDKTRSISYCNNEAPFTYFSNKSYFKSGDNDFIEKVTEVSGCYCG